MATEYLIGNVIGPQGNQGIQGNAGISVTGSEIDANGHLIQTLSDGTKIDAGVAKGDPTTVNGKAGQNITLAAKDIGIDAIVGLTASNTQTALAELISENGKKADAEDVRTALAAKPNRNEISNTNILINGDFGIWQRGFTFSSPGYTADRWLATYAKDVNIIVTLNGGLNVTLVAAGTTGNNIFQVVEFPERYAGRTLTLSANVSTDATYRCIYIGYVIQGGTMQYNVMPISPGSFAYVAKTVTIPKNITRLVCGLGMTRPLIQNDVGTYATMHIAKLEYGTVATPFMPRLAPEELALCQRFYQKRSTDVIDLSVRPTMRTTPTVTAATGGFAFDAEIY